MFTTASLKRTVQGLCLAAGAMVVLGLGLCPGCAKKFTRTDWEMVQVGASNKDEVQMTMGAPMEKASKEVWWYHKGWIDAFIYFNDNDTVRAKKWYNAKTNEKEVCPAGWSDK
jgi:hypothetical protein